MTKWAVTVVAYGDHIVEADTSEEACDQVASLGTMMSSPDSDWYLCEVESVREENE